MFVRTAHYLPRLSRPHSGTYRPTSSPFASRDESIALATTIAGYSPPAKVAIKEWVKRGYESSLLKGMSSEWGQLPARFGSEDASEGMSAFLDQRKPVFRHRWFRSGNAVRRGFDERGKSRFNYATNRLRLFNRRKYKA
jgi:hypothetical protein